jgi:hypothetical protein
LRLTIHVSVNVEYETCKCKKNVLHAIYTAIDTYMHNTGIYLRITYTNEIRQCLHPKK